MLRLYWDKFILLRKELIYLVKVFFWELICLFFNVFILFFLKVGVGGGI